MSEKATWGAHTKRKFKYGKELSPRGREGECTQKERSTSITKRFNLNLLQAITSVETFSITVTARAQHGR